MKKAFLLFATILLFSFTTFAQNSATGSATVTAKITKGLTISNLGGSLDFGEIVATGAAQNPSIGPSSGAKFQVIGHKGKSVSVTFANATLTNNAWVTSNGGGTNASLTFAPNVQNTGGSPTYTGPTAVTSGGSVALVNVTPADGSGTLYLWVGGALNIAANQANGDYTGNFSVTVAY